MAFNNKIRTKSLWQRAVSRANSHLDDQLPIGSGGVGHSGGVGSGGVMFKDKTSSSFQKIAANLLETKRVLEKEKEIKAKSEELDELQEKLNREQDEKQKLKKQLDDLSFSQSDSSKKLARVQDAAEKLRMENKKKTDHTEKLERNISHMEDRIRNLEIRASEVEKAELTLESTKRNLEASQQEVRMREKELERAQEKYDDICKQLESSNNKIKDLEKKIEDLKLQVRYELMKNENIEKGLETIPRLKDDIEDRDKKIAALQKDLDEKSALLNASRKSAREYKERIRELERRDDETFSLQEELDMSKNEVDTLKRLMAGKDAMVQQKCQSLDQAKMTVDALRLSAASDDEKTRLRKIQHVLDQLKRLHSQSTGEDQSSSKDQRQTLHNRYAQSRPRSAKGDRGIDVNHHPYALENGQNKENSEYLDKNDERQSENGDHEKSSTYIFLERFLNDTDGTSSKPSQKRAKTANVSGRGGAVQRTQSFHNQHNSNETSLRSQKKAISTQNVPNSPTTRKTTTMYLNASGQRGSTGNLYTSENSHKLNSKYQPSLEYSLGVSTDEELTTDTSHCLSGRQTTSPTGNQYANSTTTRPRTAFYVSKRGRPQSTTGSDTETSSHENSGFADIVGSKLTSQQLMALSSLSASQKDSILSDVIQIGDRVTITVTQKPPRYGRKKPKPITYTGIVKYKGHLDKDHYDARIYAGLRLDAPLGESDGTFKGKRYMFTPPDHAKFFKIRDLDTVLDVPTGMYIPTPKLILHHLETHQDQIPSTSNGHHTTSNSTNNWQKSKGDSGHNSRPQSQS